MKILTRGGFKEFEGVLRKKSNCYCIELEYTIGAKGEKRGKTMVSGSEDHRVKVWSCNGELEWKRLDKLAVGDKLYSGKKNGKTGDWAVTAVTCIGEKFVFTPVGVGGGEYMSGSFDHHNCSFLGSAETLIDGKWLDKMTSVEPIDWKYGYCMTVYEEPKRGALYVMGVDSAMGNAGDYSAVQVLKVEGKKRYRQVAAYHCNTIKAEDFAYVVDDISKMYNDAQYIIENNGIGRSVAEALIYDIGSGSMISTDKHGELGTKASKDTKLDACRILKNMVEKGHLTIVDSDTIDELSRFEAVTPEVFRGASGKHDDLVSALYWACYCLTQPEVDLEGMTPGGGTKGLAMSAGEDTELPPPIYMDVMGVSAQLGSDFWKGLN